MLKFIRCFIMYWKEYPGFIAFCNSRFTAEEMARMAESDSKRGIVQPRNRFEYAFFCAKTYCEKC